MSNKMTSKILGAISGIILMTGFALAASPVVERAKDQCVVGEQADGYLGFVDGGGDDALRREVRDINQQRKAYYADLAARNGVAIDVTAALTAEKLIASASAGECVRTQNGTWTKK